MKRENFFFYPEGWLFLLRTSIITLPGGLIAGLFVVFAVVEAPTREQYFLGALLGLAFAFILTFSAGVRSFRQYTLPAYAIGNFARSIGNFDLSASLEDIRSKEMEGALKGLEIMRENLLNTFSRYQEQVEELNKTASYLSQNISTSSKTNTQVARAIEDFAQEAEEQGENIKKNLELLDNLAKNINNVANLTEKSLTTSQNMELLAKEGTESLEAAEGRFSLMDETTQKSVDTLASLEKASQRIEEIINTINDISKQTHLLALNAAIEAARAGEHGSSFAIVATRIRELSQEASQATGNITETIEETQETIKEISHYIGETRSRVTQGGETLRTTRTRFDRILNSIQGITERNKEISTSSNIISQDTSKLLSSLEDLADFSETINTRARETVDLTKEQSAIYEEVEKTSKTVFDVAEEIRRMANSFNTPRS